MSLLHLGRLWKIVDWSSLLKALYIMHVYLFARTNRINFMQKRNYSALEGNEDRAFLVLNWTIIFIIC